MKSLGQRGFRNLQTGKGETRATRNGQNFHGFLWDCRKWIDQNELPGQDAGARDLMDRTHKAKRRQQTATEDLHEA